MTANVYRCTLIPVEKETMTANSELEAAIEKLISVIRDEFDTYDIKNDQLPLFTDARKAFAAYREQVAALVAENARLKAFVQDKANYKPIDDQWEDFTRGIIEGHKHWAAEARAVLTALKAAALADVETKSTSGGEQ